MKKINGHLMFVPDPKTKNYLNNLALFKYLALEEISVSDFENYLSTLSETDNKFLKCLNYIGMQANIEVTDLNIWVSNTKKAVNVMAKACGYTFKSNAERLLISYGLAFRTFAFFDSYSQIKGVIDNNTINEIISLKLDNDVDIYSMYYFAIPLLNHLSTTTEKNPHIYLRTIKIAMKVQKLFPEVDKHMIHLDEKGHLIK